MNGNRTLLLTIIFLFIYSQNYGRHIVGGTMVCKESSDDNIIKEYNCQLIIYRDCYQEGREDLSGYDNNAVIGIFENVDNQWVINDTIVARFNRNNIKLLRRNNICLNDFTCVDKNSYDFELSLPKNDSQFRIVYQRCCRNSDILNVVNASESGVAISLELSPSTSNNLPQFINDIPISACLNDQIVIDQSAIENDGDKLTYRFIAPQTSGGTLGSPENPCPTNDPTCGSSCGGVVPSPFNCSPPFQNASFVTPLYQENNPIPGLSIDESTGIIKGIISRPGRYLAAIEITEIRNGEIVGSTVREFELNTVLCEAFEEIPDFDVFVPSAFTPNNDGINDELIIGIENYECIDYVDISISDLNNNPVFDDSFIPESSSVDIWCGTGSDISCNSIESFIITADIIAGNTQRTIIDTVAKIDCQFIEDLSQYTFPEQHDGNGGLISNTILKERNSIPCLNELFCKYGIILTNAFTPDGDGDNDLLKFTASDVIEDSELWIYNRWGDQVYHKENYTNDWDGGGYPEGVYFYILKIKETVTRRSLTLLR